MKLTPVPIRSTKNMLVCPVCAKQFSSCRSDKKACSAHCKHTLQLQAQQIEAARKMTQEIQDLYQTYQLQVKTKNQTVIF